MRFANTAVVVLGVEKNEKGSLKQNMIIFISPLQYIRILVHIQDASGRYEIFKFNFSGEFQNISYTSYNVLIHILFIIYYSYCLTVYFTS